jgi:hypothetical protein
MSKVNEVRVTVQSKSAVKVTVHVTGPPEQDRRPLRFGAGNAKLDPGIWTFSLPAGHSCPHSRECRSHADRQDGTIRDGRHAKFRCYAATMEARHPSVRKSRWHNWDQLRRCSNRAEMKRLILDSLSPFARILRVHDSGDYFAQGYLDAWLDVARERPDTTFYWYTKSVAFWVARLGLIGNGYSPGELRNVVPTGSWGGTEDHLINDHELRSARVVFSEEEAQALRLEIDHDDSHAMAYGPDFALLLHGTQPADSSAAAAARIIRDKGFSGYGARQGRLPLTVL